METFLKGQVPSLIVEESPSIDAIRIRCHLNRKVPFVNGQFSSFIVEEHPFNKCHYNSVRIKSPLELFANFLIFNFIVEDLPFNQCQQDSVPIKSHVELSLTF